MIAYSILLHEMHCVPVRCQRLMGIQLKKHEINKKGTEKARQRTKGPRNTVKTKRHTCIGLQYVGLECIAA